MKRSVFVAAFVLLFQMASAQVKMSLGDFTSVKVFDRINVTLVKSSENSIEIKGDRAGEVEVVTKNNTVKIRMKLSKLLAGEDIEATLYYNGNIDAIEANEGSFVSSADTFTATSFEADAKEGALLKLYLDVKKLETSLHTGGQAELHGKAENHDATITSGGILKAKDLQTTQTDISVNAGGEAYVYATELAEAKTRIGGTIDIYGNPKEVKQKTIAGGTITVIK